MSLLTSQRQLFATPLDQGSRGLRRRHGSGPNTWHQKRVVHVKAFKTQDETISIGLDGYNLLQVNRAASRETCFKKYDEIVNSPPNAGYSQETLYSRAVVLKSATEAVIDLTATPSYRQQPGHLSVEMLYSDLPGALALLQEAGELQTVFDWGNAWLRDSASESKTKDVALALALAYCDTAAMRLEQNAADKLAAAETMTTALALLKQFGAGEQLQEEISSALQELAPTVALQQIALPLEQAEQRAEGIATISQLAWSSDCRLGMPRSHFMQKARESLTAPEQVELYERAGQHVSKSSEDQYDTALAYLAVAYSSRRPQLLHTAQRLLTAVKQDSNFGASPSDIDLAVELAVCSLLLGDSEKAEDILGLAPDAASGQADPAVKSFVMEACQSPDDLLPGLCALAERWLGDVALPGFRDSPDSPGSLTDWFSDRGVAMYLQVLHNSRRLHLGDAADAARHAISGLASGLKAALAAPLQGLQNALKAASPAALGAAGALPTTAGRSLARAEGQSAEAERQAKAASPVAGPVRSDATVRVSTISPEDGTGATAHMEARLADALVAGTDAAAKQQPNPASNDLLDEDMAPLRRPPPSRGGRVRSSILPAVPVTDGIIQFAGEREMWASFQDANLRKRRRLKGLLGGAALLVAVLAVRAVQQHRAGAALPPAATPLQTVSQAPEQGAQAFTEASARALLMNWQSAKADALGPEHKTNRLDSVLSKGLLTSWQAQAETVQSENKHWEYDLRQLDILSVDADEDTSACTVLVAVQEDASLFQDSKLLHVYKGTYTAEYEAEQTARGWRLTSSTITL